MPSKDVRQQSLRGKKRQFNAIYKDVSQKLKAFKNALNGKGDSKFGLPISNIKDPLPTEIGNFLHQLASDFQRLVNDAESIISEQAGYSRGRRKKVPKTKVVLPAGSTSTPPPPPTDQIVDTLSRLGSNADVFEKHASSRLSRSWQYLSSLFSRKEFNKQRIGLLKQAADLFYNIIDLENDVLNLSIDSISNAISRYEMVKYNLSILQEASNMIGEIYLAKSQETRQNQAKTTPIMPLQDIKGYLALFKTMEFLGSKPQDLSNMIDDLHQETDGHIKSQIEERIRIRFDELTKEAIAAGRAEYNTNINSLTDLVNAWKRSKQLDNVEAGELLISITKIARSPITRFLKRQLVKLIPFNKTATIRLEIANIIDHTKATLHKLMNSLEKELNFAEVVKELREVDKDINKLRRPMYILSIYYKEAYIAKQRQRTKHKGKYIEPFEDPFMGTLLKRRVKRDIGEDLF